MPQDERKENPSRVLNQQKIVDIIDILTTEKDSQNIFGSYVHCVLGREKREIENEHQNGCVCLLNIIGVT